MSQVFVSNELLAVGPYIFPALCFILLGAALSSGWLIWTGVRRRIWWRLVVGMPVALYVAFVLAAGVSIIA